MARPKKEGMDYFPHDTDSVNDEKVEALRMLYGNDGYAFYFILLERIYRTKNAELDVSDAETMQILSRKVGVTLQEFENMLKTALKRDCFDRNEYEKRGVLTSNGIKKRLAPIMEKREKMRRKYVSEIEKDSCVVSDAETQQKPDKVKERKVKESIIKPSIDYESEFECFWNIYKKKTDKKKALDKFKIARKKYSLEQIMHGAQKYMQQCDIKKTEMNFIKGPAVFLNGENFNDEFETTYTKPSPNKIGQVDFDSLRRELEDEQTTGIAYHPNNNHILPKQIQNGRSESND